MSAQLTNLAERVAEAFLTVFVGVLIAARGVTNTEAHGAIPWLAALDQGGFAAVVALIAGLLALHVAALANPWLDLVYRAVVAFGASLLASLTMSNVDHSLVHFQWATAAYVALLAMVGAVIKALVGMHAPTTGAAVVSGAQVGRNTR